MVRCGSDFGLCSLEDLLVAAINELGDFSADQVAGISENLDAVVAILRLRIQRQRDRRPGRQAAWRR